MSAPYISVDLRNLRKVTDGNEFVIAGSGKQAVRILKFLSPRRPEYITDMNPAKWGSDIFGLKVVSPAYFQAHMFEIVICSSLNYFIMAKQLSIEKGGSVIILPPVELIYGTDF